MNKTSNTKDARLLIELYQAAIQQPEPTDYEADPYILGQKVGLAERGVNAIVLQLVRSNFIKRFQTGLISITQTGIRVAISLLE